MQSLTPNDYFQSIDQVLFIMDLSIRDFIYFQTYLTEFINSYPKTKIDLMINLYKPFLFKYKNALQIKSLKDMIKEQNIIKTIYFEPGNQQNLIRQAQETAYKSIILLDKDAQIKNIETAIQINPKSFLIGTTKKIKWFNFFKKRAYKSLNLKLDILANNCDQFTNFYSSIFSHLNGKETRLKPTLQIPKKWIVYAKLRFLKWGINKKSKEFGKVLFINLFDDNGNCTYPLKSLFKSVIQLKQNDEWGDVNFILNVPPHRLRQVKTFFADHSVNNLFLLCADYDFFQIPAILSLCDAVFSVDSFCMDLANAFNIQAFEINKLNNIENNEQNI